MQVKFYNNSSDNDEVKKNISLLHTKDCKLYEDCTIQNPRLIVNMDDNIINANYVYIAKFKRYYYITKTTIKDGTIAIVDCKVDVLMSFWDSFKNSQCIALRSSSNYNNMIGDNEIVKLPTAKYVYRKLPTKFVPEDTGNNYVLTIGGGN